MTPRQLDDPSSRRQIPEFMDKIHEGGHTTFESVHVSKQGRQIPVEISSHIFALNGQKVVLSSTREITDRKRADLVRQVMYNIAHAVDVTTDSSELYEAIDLEVRHLIDATNLFIGLYNKQDDTISIAFMRDQKDHFETVPAEKTISSLVIKERRSMLLREADMEHLETEGRIGSVGSAAKAWLGVPLQSGDEVIGIVVVQSYESEDAFDASDLELLEFVSKQVAAAISKKQAEEEIGKLLRSVEQSPAAMVITDLAGAIEYVNPKFEDISGYSLEEIKGACAGVLCPGTLPEREYQELWGRIRAGGEWRGEVASTRKSGELFWEWVSVSSIRNEQGEITRYLVVQEDITQRKELQEQLNQAQKMESIGTLAGGIAHDFNNLLTVINGHAEMCLMCLPRDSDAYGDVAAIQHAGRRAADLTKQLLAFGRKQMYEAKTVDLNQVIGGLDKLLSRLIGEDISIETRLRHDVPPISADPGQLEQILMNLIVNARDAINEHKDAAMKKQIHIETDRVQIDEAKAQEIAELEPGAYVLLAVSDSGTGMSDETQHKIFEPFFTTKGRDKGTGLGLSTVYGIVRQNGGGVEVESELGLGTTFKIYWPSTLEQQEEESVPVAEPDAPMGEEVVLLVEDDHAVRRFAARALRELGYSVHEAENGRAALDLVGASGFNVQLLVTDLVMPEMNGTELAHRITDKYPAARVLFTSGYTEDTIVRSGAVAEGVNFLAKPYTLPDFARKVREALDDA
ncbi:MAG: PAS domain S-box protein, partial [Gemmatimonadota bacterium]